MRQGHQGAVELMQGEPLLLTYRIHNGMSQVVGVEYGSSSRQLRLEVSRSTVSKDTPKTQELVAKWPPAPKKITPRRISALTGPLVFEVPRVEGRRLSPGSGFDRTVVIPLQDLAGKALAVGSYQAEVFVELPVTVEKAVQTGQAGQSTTISTPGDAVRGKFQIPLKVRPSNPTELGRSARKLRDLAATESKTDMKLYVDALLSLPTGIAYSNCRSLAYDVQGDRERSNTLIESLKAADTPQAVDLLGQMAWRLKDEEAKRALARLYSEKVTAGDTQGADRIATLFAQNRADVRTQSL